MLRQIHGYPKLILNEAEATCTDTIHRVRFNGVLDKRCVVAAFMNVLTFAFAEVTGRGYGGGVLTFEPSEAERLPLPLTGAENLDLDDFDRLLRTDGIETVLARTDEILLKRSLGLSNHEVKMLQTIWTKLRDRRIARKHKK
jgi:adenine-specific DNA-methyltransferase